MKCLVTGGNVKGELGLAGRWGGGTWDSPKRQPNPMLLSPQCWAGPSTLYPVLGTSSTWSHWTTG